MIEIDPIRLWITAKVLSPDGLQWELAGVFSSRGRAVAACRDRNYCIWPMNLNEAAPDTHEIHPEAEYPFAEVTE